MRSAVVNSHKTPPLWLGTGCTRVAADIRLPRGELAQPENHLSSRA